MHIVLPEGKWVVAVSGGVDSMVLLHYAATLMKDRCIVVHVNHGIRTDSTSDENLVAEAAKKYALRFETVQLKLPADCSEEYARTARYGALDKAAQRHRAAGIMTAHHRDDVIETSVFLLMRGTGTRGFANMLIEKQGRSRPLLHFKKEEIITFAEQHGITWREDSTNKDTRYTRNKIRQLILPRIRKTDPSFDDTFFAYIEKAATLSRQLDTEMTPVVRKLLHKNLPVINRELFCQLPPEIAAEALYCIFQKFDVHEVNRLQIHRAAHALRNLQPGKKVDICHHLTLLLTKRSGRLVVR